MGFKLAIFISGRGSNMKEIVRACQRKELKSSIGLIVSNNIKAPGLLLPEIKNIPILTLDESNLNNKEFYLLLEKSLINNGIELICLAGFMKVLDKAFCKNTFKFFNKTSCRYNYFFWPSTFISFNS